MLKLERPWTRQPQYAALSKAGFAWVPAFGKLPISSTTQFGTLVAPAAATSVGSVPFVASRTFTVIVVFCAPVASSTVELLRIGGGSDGVRLNVTSAGSGSINPAVWTLNGVANLLPGGTIGAVPSTYPFVSILAVTPSTTYDITGAVPENYSLTNTSPSFSEGSSSNAIAAPTDFNVQVSGVAGIQLYGVFVLPRAIRSAEAKEYVRNPWQLLQPRRIWIPVTAAAGGNATVALTGAATTSSPGAITAAGDAAAGLTGAAAASAAGTVSASASTNATASLTGAATASAAGTAAATGGAAVTVTGAQASSAAGTASAAGSASTALTGASTASAAGTTTATAGGNATATLVGSSTASAAGTMAATGAATAAVTGAASASAAGAVGASIGTNATVALTGAAVIASAGALVVSGAAQIILTGASSAASAGAVSAAGQADATVALSGAAAVAACGTIAAVGGVAGTGATAEEVWESFALEAGLTPGAMLRIVMAAVAGRTEGVGTDTERYFGADGNKVRLTATFDANSNRTTILLDGSP